MNMIRGIASRAWSILFVLTISCHCGLIRPTRGEDPVCLEEHKIAVMAVAFSPDGKRLASADSRATVIFWDVATWKVRSTFKARSGNPPALAFSPSGKLLATLGARSANIWDVDGAGQRGETAVQRKERLRRVGFSSDGRRLAIAGRALRVFQVEEDRLTELFVAHSDNIIDFHFGKESLLTVGREGIIRYFDVATGEENLNRRLSTGSQLVFQSVEGKYEAQRQREINVLQAVFSKDGRLLAFALGDKSIEVWDLGTRKRVWIRKRHQSPISSIAFSPDSKLLATGGSRRRTLSFGLSTETGLSFETGLEDETVIRVWNVRTGREPSMLEGHTSSIDSLAFSPDGKLLASASEDKTIRLWDIEQLQEDANESPADGVARPAEEQLIGTWALTFEVDEEKLSEFLRKEGAKQPQLLSFILANHLKNQDGKNSVTYNADGSLVVKKDGESPTTQRWRLLEKKDNTLKLETTKEDGTISTVRMQFLDAERISLQELDDSPSPTKVILVRQ